MSYEHLLCLLQKNSRNLNCTNPKKLHALLLISGYLNQQQPSSSSLRNIACNAVLRNYINSANFSAAIHFFNHLVSRQCFVPDNHTYPLILKACSELFAIEQGRNVHHLIRRFSQFRSHFTPNAFTKCALIHMFAKCGSLDEARMVFDDMPQRERDLASWTALICGNVHHGECFQALSLFKMMRLQGTSPDSVLVAALLPACGRLEAKKVGLALQGFSVRSGFHQDLFVSNALVDMYCKFGDTHQAYRIFCRMLCKDDVSWGTLIAGYSQNCEYRRSLEVYYEMINLGLQPSAVAMASILPAIGQLDLSEQGRVMHGYILKQGFDSDVVVGSAMMEMYSNCGLTGEMESLLSIWSDLDIMLWNSAIGGHASAGNFDQALSLFRKIWESEFKPNNITLMSILPVCTKMGALKRGMEVHGYAIKSSLRMAVSVSNSIIDMYCKCGYLSLGLKIFDHMMENDIISYNTIISAYGFHGYGKQALDLFDEMKSLAIMPTKVTFVNLLSACSHAGLVDEGWSLYHSMINHYGILPDTEHYSCMVDLLGRAGRVDDACNFVRMMPGEPDGNILGCLLAACSRVDEKIELTDFFAEESFRDKLEDSGYHILLSNMYASTKKWKDASRARALIKERSLRKKPGNSWIQIGNGTHIFNAKDTTHPEFQKIEQLLEKMFLEMKMQWHEETAVRTLNYESSLVEW